MTVLAFARASGMSAQEAAALAKTCCTATTPLWIAWCHPTAATVGVLEQGLVAIYAVLHRAAVAARRPLWHATVLPRTHCGHDPALAPQLTAIAVLPATRAEAEAALERRTSAGLTSVPLIEAASEHADAETDTLAPAATAAAAVAPLPTVTDSIADVADPVVGVAHTTAASSTALPVGTTAAADAAVGTYSTVCLGGTFDHLHAGHKVLLTVAALWARERVCCGVATAALLKHKLHATTVEDYATRAEGVRRFLGTVRASVTADVLPIDDAFGPTVTLPELEALTVSAETRLGADAINAERLRRGYAPLAVHAVSLVNGGNAVDKLSSTLIRAYIAGGELDGNMFE